MINNGSDTDKPNSQYVCLNNLVVRPITTSEESEWDMLMTKYHYLGFNKLTGRTMKYIALLDNQWVALLGWGSSVLKCTPRDQWIDWTPEQKYKRLQYVANNQRYLILPGKPTRNLASRALALNTKRLSDDWVTIHGHPIVMVETFVEHNLYKGTCYRAAGWLTLGRTAGYGRSGGKYFHHGRTKTVLVKPLVKNVAEILSAEFVSPELKGGTQAVTDLNSIAIEGNGGLLEHLALLTDSRKKRGVRHSQVAVLAVAICALLSGAKSFVAIGEWAASLEISLLKRLGCRYNLRLGRYVPPSEKTLRNTLKRIDADEADNIIGQWLFAQTKGNVIAVDGKTARGSAVGDGKPVHLVAAFLHHEGIVINQRETDKKSNEITAFIPLLEPLDIEGKIITADAMHTQTKNANFLVEEKNADYILPVKQNQGALFQRVSTIDAEDFSPSGASRK
jgi:hypothetical protein